VVFGFYIIYTLFNVIKIQSPSLHPIRQKKRKNGQRSDIQEVFGTTL